MLRKPQRGDNVCRNDKISFVQPQRGDNCHDFRPVTAPLGLNFGLNPIATNIIAPLGLVKGWKSIG
jgi:hypothetical protein